LDRIQMKPFAPIAALGVGLVLVVGLALWWVRGPEQPPAAGPGSALALLQDFDAAGFPTPRADWSPSLPPDLAAHPGFLGEIWTVSGTLRDDSGRLFGFQLGLARVALSPAPAERASAWATNQIYRAHFTLTAEDDARARTAERLSRAALELAGSRTDRPRVWVRDWALEAVGDGDGLGLTAEAPGARLELTLEPERPVLSGAALELFPASADAPAFVFYVLPRLAARGSLTLDGRALAVTGVGLMDHGWGSVPGLAADGSGPSLNRFAAQLDDGRDLLCLLLQRADGSGRPIPSCALVLTDGRVQTFRRRELTLTPTRDWRSPDSGRVYPVAWGLGIEPIGLRLALEPLTADQVLSPSLPLWNGAVTVTSAAGAGAKPGTSISGSGRIEVTATQPPGRDD
jgi:predicted secreted hydrolase